VIEQALDQIAPVRDVRADHRGFQVAKVHAQDALGHAHGALVAFVVVDQFAQVDRRGELHAGLAPQNDDAQQRRRRPVTAQLSANSSFHGLDSLSGDWPQNTLTGMICAFGGVLAQGADQAGQGRRRAALVLAAEPVRVRGQVEERRGFQQGPTDTGSTGRQAGLGAFGVDHGQVGERRRLQDVEHRAAAVQVEGERRLVDRLRANPEVQQSAQVPNTDGGTGNGSYGFCVSEKTEQMLGRSCRIRRKSAKKRRSKVS
jgi:hypothetical protein